MELKDLQNMISGFSIEEIVEETNFLESITSTSTMDEDHYYKKLSKELIKLEKTVDYGMNAIDSIRKVAEQMYLKLDEKAELLMRCEWLEVMKAIEQDIAIYNSLESVQAAKRQLGRVQTCPLKNELNAKLDELEAQFATTKVLSPKDQLVQDIFATGNETFINLGTAGRDFVLEKVLNEQPSVELAIAKAEALEAQVQAAKQVNSIEAFQTALAQLPLQHYSSIEEVFKTEVLELLLTNANWNSLFNLDLQIRNTVIQVHRKHNPVQEGILQTVLLDDKVIERLSVQQVQV